MINVRGLVVTLHLRTSPQMGKIAQEPLLRTQRAVKGLFTVHRWITINLE